MNVTRILLTGMVLATVAVALFLALWGLLGALGVSDVPRLFASLCLPPVVVGLILLALIVIRQSHGPDAS